MILLLGVSGSGKTLQGSLLAQRLGYTSLSMGQLLRDHADQKTQELLKQGIFLDQHTTGKILKKALQHYNLDNVVLDGYPRTKEQAEWVVEQVQSDRLHIKKVIVLEADDYTVISRVLSRGRSDDTDDAIRRRLDSYYQEIDSVIGCLEQAGLSIDRVDANLDVESVYKSISKVLKRDAN